MTGQPYMIVDGSAMAYPAYPLAVDPNNPAKTSLSQAISSYTLSGSTPPTFTTSVCCAINVNGCNVVSAMPPAPQPVPSSALGWTPGGKRVAYLPIICGGWAGGWRIKVLMPTLFTCIFHTSSLTPLSPPPRTLPQLPFTTASCPLPPR